MVQSSGKTTNVSNDTTTSNQNWLISRNTILLQFDEDGFNILDVLVDLIAAMNQLDEFDAIDIEVVLQDLAVFSLDLVTNDSDTSSKWLVHLSEDFVGWVKDTSGDLDRCGESGAHDCLDVLRVWCGDGVSITVSVDACWVDGVRIDLFESDIIVKVLLGI